ncbi:MAG: rhodanese-like domain-containing protein [Guyparkeria sp.]
MAAYESISADDLSERLGEVSLFDVRGPAETQRGVIEGATLVPLHLVPMNVDRFRGDRDVVVYCHSGARSAQACQFLAAQGIERLFNLAGGVMLWAGSGRSLVAPDGDSDRG